MLTLLRRSLVAAVLLAVLCGLAYPLAVTGIAHVAFAYQASGSIGADGSTLIGQRWTGPQWFHGRPDANNPMTSGATNLGPRSAVLAAHVKARILAWHRLGVDPTEELVTSSGSGLDPDISPASALVQVPMVAQARGLPIATVRSLVEAHVHPRQWGFLGEPYVDVLALNQALAALR
ncbi:MAG: potassium-transporting ATPase subunit C [Actinomycetes bacterium]